MTQKNIRTQKHSVKFLFQWNKRNLRKVPVLWDWITIMSVFCICWCVDKLGHSSVNVDSF